MAVDEPKVNPLLRVVKAAALFRMAEQYSGYPRAPTNPKFKHELWEALDALAFSGAEAELKKLETLSP